MNASSSSVVAKKPPSKVICAHFFELVRGAETHKCLICKGFVGQSLTKGYANLLTHVERNHPAAYNAFLSNSEGVVPLSGRIEAAFYSEKARRYWMWLRIVIMEDCSFRFCESPTMREFFPQHAICTNTFMKYMELVYLATVEVIKNLLPPKFGLVFDGWSDGLGNHFCGIFAVGNKDGESVRVMLTFQRFEDETNQSAQNYIEFMNLTLETFGRTIESVTFLVGDNCATNKKISEDICLPLIGCYSHRLNLALTLFLKVRETLLAKVDSLMTHLRTPRVFGLLKRVTKLTPVRRNKTRWSSTYEFLERYLELHPFLEHCGPTIVPMALNMQEYQEIKVLVRQLKMMNEATKLLQRDDVNMLQAQQVFKVVVENFPMEPGMQERYLNVNAIIATDVAFSTGIARIIERKEHMLTDAQRTAVQCFLRPSDDEDDEERYEEQKDTDISDWSSQLTNIFDKPTKRRRHESNYIDLKFIPPTSNCVERMFSVCKNILGDDRHAMTPEHFEMVVFLKMNHKHWTLKTVNDVINAPSPSTTHA